MTSDGSTSATVASRLRRYRWLLDISLVLVAVLFLHWLQTRSLPRGDAPALAGRLATNGEQLDLGQMRGRPVLVHFWSTWCPVCGLEEGSIASIARDHPVVGIAWRSGDSAAVRGYLARENLQLPTLVDPDGRLSSPWNIRGVPSSFVIDGDGKIRFVEVGYTTELGLRARLWLAEWI